MTEMTETHMAVLTELTNLIPNWMATRDVTDAPLPEGRVVFNSEGAFHIEPLSPEDNIGRARRAADWSIQGSLAMSIETITLQDQNTPIPPDHPWWNETNVFELPSNYAGHEQNRLRRVNARAWRALKILTAGLGRTIRSWFPLHRWSKQKENSP